MTSGSVLRIVCALSLCLALPLSAATITVTNTNDSGAGSLRDALTQAAAGTYDRIEFAIGSGPQTIQPLSELPAVGRFVTIDGTTQPGYSGRPLIEIDGTFVTGNYIGLDLNGEVIALVINNFYIFNGGAAIRIGNGAVRGCYLGTDHTGTVAEPNYAGILVAHVPGTGSAPGEVMIGGPNPADGNLISGNTHSGVSVITELPLSIQGNTFGSDIAQTAPLGSTQVHVSNGYDGPYFIGGVAPNVFVGATNIAISSSADGAHIRQNFVGVTPAGTVIPNHYGIVVGGTGVLVQGNTVKGNTASAVLIGDSAFRVQVTGNSIDGNGFGVDIAGGSATLGATPNDPGDTDTGPNNLINFPILTRAIVEGGTTVTGTLSSVKNRTYHIELFASPSCSASGHGEGRDFLGGHVVSTDSSGQASFTVPLPWMAPGTIITATSTSVEEGTSEFSPCVTVESPGVFSFQNATVTVPENDSSAMVTVQRLQGAAGAATVSYAVSGGTAINGSDFSDGSGTLAFADGEALKTITIPLVNDVAHEGAETIILYLSSPTNGTAIGTPGAVTITINDDDPPPSVSIENTTVAEGNGGTSIVEVRFSLSGPAVTPFRVEYGVSSSGATPGVDYIASGGELTFLAGETEKRVPFTIVGDTTYEPDESFEIILSASPSIRGVVTILNDDARPTVSVSDLRVAEGNGQSTVQITIGATTPVTGSVSFTLMSESAQAGSDFLHSSGSIEFNNQTSRTILITLMGDTEPESNETFRVVIDKVWGDFGIGENGQDHGVVTIVNDDVGVGPAQSSIAVGQTATFTVQLGEGHTQDATIMISCDAPDAVSVPGTLVIRAGTTLAEFQAAALLPDRSATIRVLLPAPLGGGIHELRVQTYARATLQFTPSRVDLIEGQTKLVSVSVDPPNPITIGLTAVGPVQVPPTLTIPAGQSATFTVTAASRRGAFTILAQLPVEHGSEVQALFGDVVSTPTTPAILSITPSHGPTTGATSVSVKGANFRPGCTLTFGGQPAESVQIIDATSMSAVTPAHAPGSVDVRLQCGSDSFTFRSGFAYVAEKPRISEVSPAHGTTYGGTHVRVLGLNFDSSCWVFFGSSASRKTSFGNQGILTAVTPPRTPGDVDVIVRCSAGTFAMPLAYQYRPGDDPAPLITGVEPSAASPGELVTVKGLNFRVDDAAKFDTTAATILGSLPDAHIVRVPELPAGRTSILVTDRLARTTTSGPLFSILEVTRPRITSIQPTTIPAGGEVELIGEGFRPGYTFQIGGRSASTVTSDYTRAIVRVDRDTPAGSHPVEIHNSAAGVLASVGPNVAVVADGMILTSVDPRCATTEGGIFATLRGTGFTSASTVAFDGVAATDISLIDATTLRARVPAGTAGPAIVTVTNATNTATLSNGFTYDSPFAPRDSCGGRMRAARH